MESTRSKADDILDAAERFVRTQGYNGFSFRDVAAEVGIKSASVHYHFPTKADLGAAVARRYAERLIAGLGDPTDPSTPPRILMGRYVTLYRNSLRQDRQMCLCGMLGAEVAALPAEVAAVTRSFFERNVDWLETVLSRLAQEGAADRTPPRRQALTILATLQGALIIARTLERDDVFDEIVGGATGV